MTKRKNLWLPLLIALTILVGSFAVVNASVIPAHGPGQIGLSSVVLCQELTIRKSPSSGSKAVQKLKYGDRPIVLEQKKGWAKVILSDAWDAEPAGWVNADYLAIDPAWYVTDGTTYVYAWDSTKAPKVALLQKGEELAILKEEDGWYIVSLRGATGWIKK